MKTMLRTCITLTALLLFGPCLVSAGEVAIPHAFAAGEKVVAAQVNANFNALRTGVNDNDSRISALEASSGGGQATFNAYLRLAGTTQGDILGGVTEAGHEDSILVTATSHEVMSSIDQASGTASGKRQHKPFVITKETDKSSPLLYYAFVNNENISSWQLDFYEPSKSGVQMHTYTIKLVNACISGIHHEMLSNKKEVEHISFVYQKIIWIWVDGGITTMADWVSPAI